MSKPNGPYKLKFTPALSRRWLEEHNERQGLSKVPLKVPVR